LVKKFIFKNKGVIVFSIFKYLEIGITALTTFVLAKKIGEQGLGKALPVLLFITYANYFSLGVNQVILKNYSTYEDDLANKFLLLNFQYLSFISFLVFLLSFSIIDFKYFIFVSIIAIGNIFRSYFMTYYRVKERSIILNKNNLIFSLLLFTFIVIFTNTLKEYLFFWSISISISIVLYLCDDLKYFLKLFRSFFTFPDVSFLKKNILEGIRLAMIGFVSTILLTIDRFIINDESIDLAIKGSYQLSDFVGTAYYMVLTTIIFYFYPKLIAYLREDDNAKKHFLKYIKLALKIFPIVIVIAFFSAIIIQKFVFPEYQNLPYFISSIICLKSLILISTSFSMYYISGNQELKYLKSMIILISGVVFISVIIKFYFTNYIIYIPNIISFLILIEILFKINLINEKNSDY